MKVCIQSFLLILSAVLLCHLGFIERARSAEFGSIEIGGYALGSWPKDQDLYNRGTTVPASVQSGFGAGFTVGLFPTMLRGIIGLAFDSNLHGGALSFSNIAQGQRNERGRSDLLVSNTTANLVFRYPGERVRPYIGAGVGWSSGTLLNPNIAGRNDQDFDSTYAFVHQFLGGAQVSLTTKVFLFGEYRYVSANYHWEKLAFDFRTHYGLFGIGLRF
ncbi:MAG TPA: outer membrane beta-barrel protein [Nitrospira sp.]|nr:outer membrane beta-barrel protein [Nitrospira sp.]